MNPWLFWAACIAGGVCAGLASAAIVQRVSIDALGYLVAAVGGAVVGHLAEARHPAHFGGSKE